MRLDHFLAALPSMWEGDPATSDGPTDWTRYARIIDETKGMGTPNGLAVLNLAARHLEGDEVYLEVGSYLGTSIIGATLGNRNHNFIGIDNFSQFEGPQKQCEENIARLAEAPVRLIAADAWRVFKSDTLAYRVGVYFYDGGHTFVDQWRGLELAEPYLADRALVVVDDASHPPVHAANRLFTRGRPAWTLVAHYPSPHNGEPRWWNGIDVYAFRRASGKAGPNLVLQQLRKHAGLAVYGPAFEWRRRAKCRLRTAVRQCLVRS
jgi:predicted O-methyltransferase YrrM